MWWLVFGFAYGVFALTKPSCAPPTCDNDRQIFFMAGVGIVFPALLLGLAVSAGLTALAHPPARTGVWLGTITAWVIVVAEFRRPLGGAGLCRLTC
ncbi:hypothetical protein JIG36_31385 [Actinoplanes sp. LDG1-06]|uniref:Uncharacterized protein n=1 Tax=Paractinoplanes ovalisporus TaxID=2810368 RepID=A0ABS2AJP4_9ACTN|nr:hypothetical protein [Actinoplanes ovalisporus]MBM2620026.1 hypothetical protein [Actinoplanes ovalisporus]